MRLTDLKIRKAAPSAKPQRIADGGGLFIEVRPNGAKLWRYAYRLVGKQRLLALGAYPETSLSEAREAHAKARKQVKAGHDPVMAKAQEFARAVIEGSNTFEAIAREWEAKQRTVWGASRREQVARYLRIVLIPEIGARPIRSITSADLLYVVRLAEKRGPSVALVVQEIASAVFSYAVVTLRADSDPVQPIRGAVTRPAPVHAESHGSATLTDLYARVKAYTGSPVTRIAVEMLMLSFVRTAELRGAMWSEFDMAERLWTIPAERMKKSRKHVVPLAPQMVTLLDELRPLSGAGEFLFPNARTPGKIMSRMTINRAIEYMGIAPGKVTGHDFRATASTHLHEKGWPAEVVEMQLAHASANKVASAYNHARYMPQRIEMMAYWSAYLDARKSAANPAARRPRGRRQPMKIMHPATS